MPIKTRIDILSTSLRTPVGIKVYGPALGKIEEVGKRIEDVVKQAPGTVSVFSERVTGARYADIAVHRRATDSTSWRCRRQWPARSAAY